MKKKTAAKKPVFIIAEIGKNFIQSEEDQAVSAYIQNAKDLIDAAKEAGADAVKFQTHTVEDEQLPLKVVSPHFKAKDRHAWLQRNEKATPSLFWKEISDHSKKIGIVFFSTPMSRLSAKKLSSLDVPLWKVGSGDVLDFVLLDHLAETKKPIILSTGMSTLEEIDRAVDFLKKRNADITLMHCVSKYPCPPEELRLGTISFLKKRYGIPVGFSDHSLGHEHALAAAALGASVIEKHFTLDREHYGSDHKVSMLPGEFAVLVRGIREGEAPALEAYSDESKTLHADEAVFRPIFRKALVAGKDIKKGETITKESVYAMRPGGFIKGLPSEEFEAVLGKIAKKAIKKYEPLTHDMLKENDK